ncbi:hypothetical protein J1614_006230 [Plenodomus biglobosus]|nr:hypothetical protein J1614_006230 [Plenodomus biglobosus]
MNRHGCYRALEAIPSARDGSGELRVPTFASRHVETGDAEKDAKPGRTERAGVSCPITGSWRAEKMRRRPGGKR